MLDVDGDGLLTFPEMLESINEAFTAREAGRKGWGGGEAGGRGCCLLG